MEENQAHIPEGWEVDTILNLCQIGRGRVINQKEITDNIGAYPVYSSQTQNNGEMGRIDTYDFEGDYVTWTTDGANAGTVFFRSGKFNCTNVCGTLKEKDQYLDLRFLAYKLSTVAKNHVSYVGNPKLMNGTMSKVSLVIPKSKTEQTQIATILSKVDEAITKTEQLIAKYTRIKTGLMQDLLTKGIDENGNIRSEETHEFKDSALGRIPKEWECVDITKFTKNYDGAVKPGPFGSSLKKEFYTESGYKIYGQEQVIANAPFTGDYFIDEKRYKSLYGFRVCSGDVLLSCVGTIGSVLIIPENYEEGIINPRLIKFSLNSSKTNICFFAEYLKHSSINTQLINLATGGTMPVLNKKIVLSLHFVYPEIDEQNRINDKWSIISNHIKNEEIKLSKLQSLKTGLMQDLLSGRVRVYHLIKETVGV